MPSAVGLSGDIIAGGLALAGLILVFLGAISTSFAGYQKAEQSAVRTRYQLRAWFAFAGLCLALLAAGLALLAKWAASDCAAVVALTFLVLSIVWVGVAAFLSVREIR
jgi:hypothetical protein